MDGEEEHSRKAQAARIRQAREAAGYKSAAAAIRRFKWPESGYRHHENGTRAATFEFANYAKAYRVSEAWLRCITDDKNAGIRGAPVIGQAAIDIWHGEMTEPTAAIGRIVSVPVQESDENADARFAIRVADASVDKALPRDWFAICVAIAEEDAASFLVGELLYIERVKRGLRELSLRRVSASAGVKMQLSTHSTDAKLKQHLAYPSANAGERIRLIGRVVGKYADYIPN